MSAITCHHATGFGSIQPHHANHVLQSGTESSSVKMISKDFGINMRLITRGYSSSRSWKLHVVPFSASHSSVVDPIQSPLRTNATDSPKKSNEVALILIRHGESMWNEKNLFTGCVDVPLTQKGVAEAIEAGKRISNIPIDMVYTSSLIRAQMTAMLALAQHRQKKVPIIMHQETERAEKWSRVYSEEIMEQSVPVVTAWQLNERM